MRPPLSLVFATALLLSSASAALAQSQTFDLAGFDKLDIANGIAATVTVGSEFSVTADAGSQQALDSLKLTVDGDTLSAGFDQNFLDFIMSGGIVGKLLSPGPVVKLAITMPALSGLAASSGADVDATGASGDSLSVNVSSGADVSLANLAIGTVSVEVSSGSNAHLSGTCETISIDASSGADADAEGLSCKTASANASSGSDIGLFASDAVTAQASSGGDISVHGNPTTRDVDSSSGGDVGFND